MIDSVPSCYSDGNERKRVKATFLGIGRLDQTRYCAIRIASSEELSSLCALFSFGERSFTVPVYRLDGRFAEKGIWVIAFPCLSFAGQKLALFDSGGKQLWARSFSERSLRINNSITCRLRPTLSEEMRGIELRRASEGARIEPIVACPYDENFEVVRFRVIFPSSVAPSISDAGSLLVLGKSESSLVLEDGLDDTGCRSAVLSYRVRKDEGPLLLHLEGDDRGQPAFLLFSPEARSAFIRGFANLTRDAAGDDSYGEWFLAQRDNADELARQKACLFSNSPLISIIVPIFEPPMGYLRDCLDSILAQTYGRWELILVNASPDDSRLSKVLNEYAGDDSRIKIVLQTSNEGIVGNTNAGISASSGEYVAFIDQDDIVEPSILFEYVRLINRSPDLGAIYCDEDSFTDGLDSVHAPRFKPDFNRDALYSHNYAVHMLMVKRAVIDSLGPSSPGLEGAQDYDLTLKASELAPVGHVPRVLYHWRTHEKSTNSGNLQAKPYAVQAGIRAIEQHFSRRGISVRVEAASSPYTYRVSYSVEHEPLISIIIPTKDHPDLLEPCVDSLLEKAGWSNYEILLVENNSSEPETFALYQKLLDLDQRIRLVTYEGEFNYSKIINFAAREAKGDLLFFLNNDTQAISDGCIRSLAGYFQRPEVGVVGPLLLFPDGLVQTAGLALMSDRRLGFINQNLTLETHGGYLASLECPRNYSAVLGAAQMVRKDVFDAVGGYDERLAVTYNDVDFCWRVRETGKLIVYTPQSQFFHREFATRGRDAISPERAAQTEHEALLMMSKWSDYFKDGDPELNPGCDSASPWFKLPKK